MTLLSRYWIRHFTKSLWWALLPLISVCLLYPNAIAQRHPVQPCLMHCQDGASLIPGTAGSAVRLSGNQSRRTLWTGLPERTALSFRLTPHPTGSPSRSFNAPPFIPLPDLLPGLSEIRGMLPLALAPPSVSISL